MEVPWAQVLRARSTQQGEKKKAHAKKLAVMGRREGMP